MKTVNYADGTNFYWGKVLQQLCETQAPADTIYEKASRPKIYFPNNPGIIDY